MESWHLARGYRFAGVHCGIRPDRERLDLALVVSDSPASAAGVFTQNRVVAAPVQLCRERVPDDEVRGIVICSGNANACTGSQGFENARRMTAVAAEEFGLLPEQFLVCSTGIIGKQLPMPAVEKGIREAARIVEPTQAAFDRAAHAILTTDTRIKVRTRRLQIASQEITITGFAKGAAMIGPNMATMLAFVLTDAGVTPAYLNSAVKRAADQSFNLISVEGHTSTNDSLLFLANWQSGPALQGEQRDAFERAAIDVCRELARDMASDAEGASHLITITVEGLRTEHEARQVAKTVANSALVKTAVFGADPNWGRIVSAAGYAGVEFEEKDLSLWLGGALLYERGTPQPFDAAEVSAYLKNTREIDMRLHFTLGSAGCTFWTCDLGHEYVRLNADYTT